MAITGYDLETCIEILTSEYEHGGIRAAEVYVNNAADISALNKYGMTLLECGFDIDQIAKTLHNALVSGGQIEMERVANEMKG